MVTWIWYKYGLAVQISVSLVKKLLEKIFSRGVFFIHNLGAVKPLTHYPENRKAGRSKKIQVER
jgi:hypothetical protein